MWWILFLLTGDVIGFYCPKESILKYDLEEGSEDLTFMTRLAEAPAVGQSVDMQYAPEQGRRSYSLNAYITVGQFLGCSQSFLVCS